jgi:CheY-like chemotaxis protein
MTEAEQEMDGRPAPSLRRVLIVEDEWFLATMLEEMIAELGHSVFAVASKLKDGLALAERGDFDFAILDVSLHGEMSHPIADVLDGRGLPYAFATGYGAPGVNGSRKNAPTLSKPYGLEDLRRILPKSWTIKE